VAAVRKWIQNVFVEANVTANMAHDSIKAAVDATDTWIGGQGSPDKGLRTNGTELQRLY
jgi:hypothetical protein